jgi:hypothetical protein
VFSLNTWCFGVKTSVHNSKGDMKKRIVVYGRISTAEQKHDSQLVEVGSITLQLREHHQLVTHGVYQCIRHPMYSALFLYSLGQVLVLPNWIAGPSYLITFGILFVFRIGDEERMMLEKFMTSTQPTSRRRNDLFRRYLVNRSAGTIAFNETSRSCRSI